MIFDALRSRLMARTTREPNTPVGSSGAWYGRPTSGVSVNELTAHRTAAYEAGHRYLRSTVGQLPVRVMRVRGNASERVTSHPVDTLLNWRPNPELSPFQLKETLTGWAITYGNGIAEIERDAVGRVVALWPIHPDRVEFKRDTETDRLTYKISNGTNGTADLDMMDVFHIRGYGDGPVGRGVVEYAAESLGWAQATELFGASYFGNGLNASGIIEGAGNLNAAGRDRLRAEVNNRHGGPRRAHNLLILDGLMKWVKTSATPNESQFIETMQFQVEQVCRWLGVPPHKVMHLLRSTFNNIEHQSIEVVTDSITPWAVRFEEECNYKLFGQNRAGFFVKLDLKGLLRGDFKSRMEGYQILRRGGFINADFVCEIEDMPKPPNGLGQKYIVESNMTTLEKVGEDPPAPAAPEPAAPHNDNQPPAAQVRNIRALRRLGNAARAA